MPIHIHDMKSLLYSSNMSLRTKVTGKTNNMFYSIAVNQTHEQEYFYVKSSGDCIGLTENPVAFRHWKLSGPVRLQKQFEEK